MPEGDTIFRAARTLHRALAGHVVTRFETQYAQLARVHDDAPITGRSVAKVEARGKHLLMHLSPVAVNLPTSVAVDVQVDGHANRVPAFKSESDGPLVLRTHMLMSGSWHIYRVGEAWQRSPASARIIIGTATFVAVGFSVPIAEFVPADALDRDEALGRLGPDVLSPDFDAADAIGRLSASSRTTVAEALLQQQSVAGIGNVYKSELLFLARINPFLPPSSISQSQWARLMHDAPVLLRVNVVDHAAAGVVTYRGMRRTTGQSNPAQRLHVYGRHGRPCRRCGSVIQMRHHGEHNRSTYWCPTCQAVSPDGQPGT